MIFTSWKNGGSVSRFLWGRVEDYCSWIHSLELLGRKVKLWVSRKHLSSFKNACFTLRYYSIPLIYSVGAGASFGFWMIQSLVHEGIREGSESSDARPLRQRPISCHLWGASTEADESAIPQTNLPAWQGSLFKRNYLHFEILWPFFGDELLVCFATVVGKVTLIFLKWVEITRYWSARLHLSPCMAGATLVAAGNGAPDLVMTALAGPPTMGFHACWFPSFPWRREWWTTKSRRQPPSSRYILWYVTLFAGGPAGKELGMMVAECMGACIIYTTGILCVAGGAVLFMRWSYSSRQEFCRILKGLSEEELHDTVTKHHSFMQAEAKDPADTFRSLQV